jgi:uridine kinase
MPGETTRIVAVDGRGGAGKSTLAERLASELDATIVHTDDFASWESPVEWWPALLEQVLEPLARGETAAFVPNSWGGPPKERVVVEPGGIVVLEGVTSSRAAFRPYLAFSIWVETPRELCLQRGLERDGDDALPQWEAWMAAEDAYIAAERPHEHADLVVRGDEPLDEIAPLLPPERVVRDG